MGQYGIKYTCYMQGHDLAFSLFSFSLALMEGLMIEAWAASVDTDDGVTEELEELTFN